MKQRFINSLKIGFSSYGNNVAATFDFCDEIVVFECENGGVIDKRNHVLKEMCIPLRAEKIRELGVDILICGAISNTSLLMLNYQMINVLPGIAGNMEAVLNEFLQGDGRLSGYRLPGFSGRAGGNRWQRGRGAQGRRRCF